MIKAKGLLRSSVEMVDPVFLPSTFATATAQIMVSPAGLNCVAELWLGPNETMKLVTSGLISFVSTGAGQSIGFPVTMPAVGGVTLHVYLDLYVAGYYLMGYVATEDIVLPSGAIGPIIWDGVSPSVLIGPIPWI